MSYLLHLGKNKNRKHKEENTKKQDKKQNTKHKQTNTKRLWFEEITLLSTIHNITVYGHWHPRVGVPSSLPLVVVLLFTTFIIHTIRGGVACFRLT